MGIRTAKGRERTRKGNGEFTRGEQQLTTNNIPAALRFCVRKKWLTPASLKTQRRKDRKRNRNNPERAESLAMRYRGSLDLIIIILEVQMFEPICVKCRTQCVIPSVEFSHLPSCSLRPSVKKHPSQRATTQVSFIITGSIFTPSSRTKPPSSV
jgi:hypothetical protein